MFQKPGATQNWTILLEISNVFGRGLSFNWKLPGKSQCRSINFQFTVDGWGFVTPPKLFTLDIKNTLNWCLDRGALAAFCSRVQLDCNSRARCNVSCLWTTYPPPTDRGPWCTSLLSHKLWWPHKNWTAETPGKHNYLCEACATGMIWKSLRLFFLPLLSFFVQRHSRSETRGFAALYWPKRLRKFVNNATLWGKKVVCSKITEYFFESKACLCSCFVRSVT